jgi:PD-(D/E)XK nuclease superfamily
MPDVLTISAKDLGWLAMPSFCPRCFWIRRHMTVKPPFQAFPAIFQHIDGYTKRIVHGIFDRDGTAPGWLSELDVSSYIEPPTYKTLFMQFDNAVVLRGSPDGVFKKSDGSIVVVDYKTAAFLGADDPLHPIYDVQLNAYAMLLQHLGYGTVSALALIYCQPHTDHP